MMKNEDPIINALKGLKFTSYVETISRVLSAFGIVDATISKLSQQITGGSWGPIYVYRRAVIYCSSDDVDLNLLDGGACPLSLIFTPSNLYIQNSTLGFCQCSYDSLYQNTKYLSPLKNIEVAIKDPYKTLELDQLVESLYRSLIMSDNDVEQSRKIIFSVLYIAHFRCLLDIAQIKSIIANTLTSDKDKLAEIYNIFKHAASPYITNNLNDIALTKESYKYIFAIIRFDTSSIDPEILTSLIYRMAEREEAGLYGHHTSFDNVAKVLRPLLFEPLGVDLSNSSLIEKIRKTTIFDPTNGPGCYLVAAFTGLSQMLYEKDKNQQPLSLCNFCGIVTNRLAYDLTQMALVFAYSQELRKHGLLSMESINEVHSDLRIFIGNELLEDWSSYVTADENLYIVGSPEFKGAHKMSNAQKQATQLAFGIDSIHDADYSSSWLVKAARFIGGTKAKAAFVLTNSVSQGEQAPFILNTINGFGCEYTFAHRSFKWKISQSDNVGVTVVILGIGTIGAYSDKKLYFGDHQVSCSHIGANLLPDIDIRVMRRSTPLVAFLPHMRKGNMPDGATALTFTAEELDDFLSQNPNAEKYIKLLYGGDEFVNNKPRYCLWITDKELSNAKQIPGIAERIEIVRATRNKPSSTSSLRCRQNPHQFRETNITEEGNVSIIIPCVTSENREYFQMGILDHTAIVNNNVNVIFNTDIWLLALLESRMHMVWAKNSAGGHEQRPRYSAELCYNTFPVPQLNLKQKETLASLSRNLLEIREHYCDRSLAQLYNNLPQELIRAHLWIDQTVDSFYRNKPFDSDAERLLLLRDMYYNFVNNE